jgi:hypothetical protein
MILVSSQFHRWIHLCVGVRMSVAKAAIEHLGGFHNHEQMWRVGQRQEGG